MAIMQKGNKQARVAEEKVEEFLKMGYSEVDKEGEIVQVGQATDLKDIKAENDTLKAELAKYQSINLEEVEATKTENEVLKAELETLKADKKTK